MLFCCCRAPCRVGTVPLLAVLWLALVVRTQVRKNAGRTFEFDNQAGALAVKKQWMDGLRGIAMKPIVYPAPDTA